MDRVTPSRGAGGVLDFRLRRVIVESLRARVADHCASAFPVSRLCHVPCRAMYTGTARLASVARVHPGSRAYMPYGLLVRVPVQQVWRSRVFAVFGIVSSVLYIWYLELAYRYREIPNALCAERCSVRCRPVYLVRWCGQDGSRLTEASSVERAGAPRERPGHQGGGRAFLACYPGQLGAFAGRPDSSR